MSKLDLSRCTLVTVDTVCHELSELALKDCLKYADYGDVLILSDKKLDVPGARHHHFEASSAKDVCRAYWYDLAPLVQTEFIFIVHWDSWIINPKAWTNDFLKYDYIGAPWWHDHSNVGNSGFSIRSKKLAEYLAKSDLECIFPDDDTICRRYRPYLEEEGFTWAPTLLAAQFSFERTAFFMKNESFGFHGIFNWPNIMTNDQICERMKKASDYVFRTREFKQMLTFMLEKGKANGKING